MRIARRAAVGVGGLAVGGGHELLGGLRGRGDVANGRGVLGHQVNADDRQDHQRDAEEQERGRLNTVACRDGLLRGGLIRLIRMRGGVLHDQNSMAW